MRQSSSLRRLYALYGLFSVLPLVPQLVNAQHWDGPSPYGDGFAPDVTSVEKGWDVFYPAFEGNNSYPAPVAGGVDGLVSDVNETSTVIARAGQDFYLRIMPLGASITEGVQSTDGNGYRKWLRQQLRWKGWKVNMVGSKQNGNMADRDNEGHPGWVITQVHSAFQSVAGMQPNLVLINVGTNDCGGNIDPGNAGVRMKAMIDEIYSRVPGVTVILSTLVKSRDNPDCAASVSQQYRDLVINNYSGQRIGLADIYSAISMSQVSSDGIHPTDEGYKLFAAVWWNAISKLENVIQPPSSEGTVDDSASNTSDCEKVAGNARGPVRTQQGSGHDDGNYVHDRVERGAIESARIQKAGDPRTITQQVPSNMFFANIIKNDPNSDRASALDDWIRVYIDLNGVTTYYTRQNLGGGVFGASTVIDFGMDCPDGSGYAFGDFNNDGLDDFYCIKSGASVSVSLNRGGSPPKFDSIGQVVPSSSGWDILNVRIADIDGDGRADFCLVDSVDVKCSRNGGQGDSFFWQGFSTQSGLRGVVFNQQQTPVSSYQFGDINGDFRSDLFIVGDNGNVQTWTNRRSRGSGIVPEWTSSGITHGGQAETGIRNNIKFGKIYGSNRLDYIYIKEEEEWFDVRVWENKGGGATKRKGDGVFYCDMRGTGSDDYVWIYMDGHSNEVYGNTHNPPYWDPNIKITISVPGPRTGIHLADWTGNGRCDVLVQNKATGALTLWENQWDSGTKTLTFTNRGVVASPGCTEGWGVSIFDRGLRVADMDGDGRADILCLEKGGRVTGWLNRASGLFNAGQLKLSEGWDRANLRFADVENSGRADIIWVDKYTGAGRVWKNNGYAGPNGGGGGSSFSWTSRGVLYSPIDRGEVMNFANLGGLGRADLIQVYPATNEAYTFFNECGGGGAGGDDGPIESPGLPDYSTDVAIDGYVQFGDSYAAGMGTGTTTSDKCRVGSNNYGKLLYRWFNNGNIPFESRVCSGDTLSGVNNQINAWSSSNVPNVGTISVGGNDIGFGNLVQNCIITPNTIHLGSTNRQYCVNNQATAVSYMQDTSTNGLRHKLKQAYLSILAKSGRSDFHLYVTNYVAFFDQDTTDCNDSSFHYWWGGYKPTTDPIYNRIVYLTQSLRQEMNNLLAQLNTVIEGAVNDANEEHSGNQVHLVDLQPSYAAHRWCEAGDWHEPDPNVQSTWFFLSAWPDLAMEGSADQSGEVEAAEVDALIKAGSIPLPDSSTCEASLGTDPDPYAVWLCTMSQAINDDPTGPAALSYSRATTAVAAGDYNSADISWYTPTRQVKTFHPRSPGMLAYRDAIIAKMRQIGQL